MKIAFIGLGNMGGPRAHNLHKAGHEVRAFDLSQPARDKLAADGVPIAAEAKAAVAGAEVVISMLPASQHVEGLFIGAGDLLAQLPAGTLIIDCSTIAAARSAGGSSKVCRTAVITPSSGWERTLRIAKESTKTDRGILSIRSRPLTVISISLSNTGKAEPSFHLICSAILKPI